MHSDSQTEPMTVISAPGKVLLAGGYLVLDPKYSGIVVSASSRFYTVVDAGQEDGPLVSVRSPQFLDAKWEYDVHLNKKNLHVSQRPQYVV